MSLSDNVSEGASRQQAPGWFLNGYKLFKDGTSVQIVLEDLLDENLFTDNQAYTWIHLNAKFEMTRDWLIQNTSIDNMWVESLVALNTRPGIFHLGNNDLIVILRSVNLNINEAPEDMVSIRIYINKDYIISVMFRELKAIDELEKLFKLKKAPKTTASFLVNLISLLSDKFDNSIDKLNNDLDKLEEMVIKKADFHLRQRIINIRRKAIIYRRYLGPQRDVIKLLQICEEKWIARNDRNHLIENHSKAVRCIEDIEAISSRTQIIQDELNNFLTDKLNQNTYRLSIMASIFLPLTFLTGLLGVNISGLPWANDHNGFLYFNVILLTVLVIQILIFKVFKWL